MKSTDLQKKVYEAYYRLLSDEMREEIKTYRPLPKKVSLPPNADRKSAIKVIFRDKNWLVIFEKQIVGVVLNTDKTRH